MKYRGASQLMLGGMANGPVNAPGCSGMKWFRSGSDESAIPDVFVGIVGRVNIYTGRGAGRDGQYPSLGRTLIPERRIRCGGRQIARLFSS